MMKDSLEELSASIVDAIPEPLLILDTELRVVAANQAFNQIFQVSAPAIERRFVYDLAPSLRTLPAVRAALQQALLEDVRVEALEVAYAHPVLGPRTLLLNARHIAAPGSQASLLILTFHDITERKRLEALHDSEAKYQSVFENALDILMLTDSEGNIIEINRRAEEVTGYTQAELRHMNVFEDLSIPEDQPTMRQVIHDVAAGRNREYEVRWRKKDGAIVHLAGASTSRFSVQGVFLSTICVLRDITTDKQAQEALRRSEDRFRALIENSLDAILLYSADGTTLYASPSITQINGFSPQELVGKNRFDWIHPDDIEQVRNEWSTLLQEPGNIIRSEARGRHKDSSWMWIERVFHNLLADPNVRAIVVNLRDITDRKEAEEALRQSEITYRSIFEDAHDIIFRLDREGNILDINHRAEEITGYSQAELRHMNVFQDLYVLEDVPKMRQILDDLIQGQAREYHTRWRAKDGHTLYFEGGSKPFLSPSGEFLSTICTLQDITHRRQAEQALQQYTARLETLHEIDEAILAARSLTDIIEKVLQRVLDIVPCQGLSITLLDFEAREVTVYATDASTETTFPAGMRTRFEDSVSIIPRLDQLRRGQVVIEDVYDLRPSPIRQSALAKGQRLWLLVPLRVHGELIGSLNLWYDTPDGVEEGDEAIVREIADSLSVAIAQMRLFEAVSEARDRLQFLSRRLVEAQEAEQRRLARELHDQVGQQLAALKIALRLLQGQLPARTADRLGSRFEDALQLVEQSIERLRFIVSDLRPTDLDDYGLTAGLRSYARQFADRTGISVQVQAAELDPRLPVEVETALFRIAQEALINAAQHSRATQATITLEEREGLVRLIVADAGVGFDPAKVGQPGARRGLGLISMRERAEALGGRLHIESKPGQGTRVIVEAMR